MYQKEFEFNSHRIDCTAIRDELITYLKDNGIEICHINADRGFPQTYDVFLNAGVCSELGTHWKIGAEGVRFLYVRLTTDKEEKETERLVKKIEEICEKYRIKEKKKEK